MMTALNHLRSSLTALTIIEDYPREDPIYSRDELELYPIGSFADFENLTSIERNASILIGGSTVESSQHLLGRSKRRQRLVDAVPKTLERLTILECNETIVPHLFELISQKASCSPNLRCVDLEWHVDKDGIRCHDGFTKEEVKRFQAKWDAAKV